MRSLDEVRVYSASMTNYLSAPAMNRLYGWTASTDRSWADEMNLFPGILACALALLGIVTGRGRVRFAYLAGLAASVEMTRGASSVVYLWLFEHVTAFRALRSPARFDTLVILSLGVLSAYGVAFLLARIEHRRWRHLAGAALVAVLIAEYASSPVLTPVPGPTRIDSMLAKRPPSVIVELPLLSRRGFWDSLDSIYMYQGIGHFQRMLNGYSGHAPASFYQMREMMASFPDERSMTFLRNLHVDYVVVRAGLYEPEPRAALLERLGNVADLSLEGMWPDGPMGAEAVYESTRRRSNQESASRDRGAVKIDPIAWRLRSQRLVRTTCRTPADVVGWLGAMQAQDYAGAKWAIGLRAAGLDDRAIEGAFNDGAILRTHMMRPTWHFVTPADIRWIQMLTGPRVNKLNALYYRRGGLDATALRRGVKVLERSLRNRNYLTRDALGSALAVAGLPLRGQSLAYLMMYAELEGVVCSGPRQGKQFAYALLEERAAPAPAIGRDQALAELVRRYFSSHGPATFKDFAWWSGMTSRDAKEGVAMNGDGLTHEVIDGRTYWFSPRPRREAAALSRGVPPAQLRRVRNRLSRSRPLDRRASTAGHDRAR